MCGIFGLISKGKSKYSNKFLTNSITKIAELSETRGVDSSGLCLLNDNKDSFEIIKGPIAANKLFKRSKVRESLNSMFGKKNYNNLKLAFGHARLVTNGTQLEDSNNQPVAKDNIICIHNGIVVNANNLWESHSSLNREYEIDTEVLPALIRLELNNGQSVENSIRRTINKVEGTASIKKRPRRVNNLSSIWPTNYFRSCKYTVNC